jgi:chromate transporter
VNDPARALAAPRVPLREVALLFGRIGVFSFGGGLTAWVHRETVERRGWISEDEFLGALAVCQVLPGSNVANLAVHIGRRLRGATGSVVAIGALLVPPMVLAVTIAAGLARVMDAPAVHRFLEGVAAGAAGMTLSVGVRSTRAAATRGRGAPLVATLLVVAVGVLRCPLLPAALVAAALSLLLARRHAADAR